MICMHYAYAYEHHAYENKMGKVHTSIQLEEVLKLKAKRLGIEFGPLLNRILENLISKAEGGTIDIFKVREELDSIKKKKEELVMREAELMSLIFQYEEEQKKDEEEKQKRIKAEVASLRAAGILGEVGR